jgi:DNA gyrase subunit B
VIEWIKEKIGHMEEYHPSKISVVTLPEAARKRPGMFFGDIEYNGANVVVHELVANAVDLYLAGSSTKIGIKIEHQVITIEDDGPGLPFWEAAKEDSSINQVQRFLTHRHDAPTADNHAPHIHLVGGGLGLAVINAVSSKMFIQSADGERLWKQAFAKGYAASDLSVENSSQQKGTIIELTLDREIFGNNTVNMHELRKTMFEVAHLFPGLTLELQSERFRANNGLLDLAYILYKRASLFLPPPGIFYFHGKQGDVDIQVAALGDSDGETNYCSWVNGQESVSGGTHVKGLENAFKKISWSPSVALIHLIMHNPRYAGPCKDILCNKEVASVITEMLSVPIASLGTE